MRCSAESRSKRRSRPDGQTAIVDRAFASAGDAVMILSRLARTVFPPAAAPCSWPALLLLRPSPERSSRVVTIPGPVSNGRRCGMPCSKVAQLSRERPTSLNSRRLGEGSLPRWPCENRRKRVERARCFLEVGELRKALDDLAQLGAGAHDLLLRRSCHAEQ